MPDFDPQILREYSLLADGERGIIVGPRGDFSWMCFPRWDDEAVFSSMLGGPGLYAVAPARDPFVWGGHYEEGTLIWRSRWVTTGGIIECREALAMPAETDRAVVLRRIVALRGAACVRVQLDARAGYGESTMSDLSQDAGVWTARSGRFRLRWTGAEHAQRRDGRLQVEVELAEGEEHDLVLEIAERALPDELVDPTVAWDGTESAWAQAVPTLAATIAARDARHAYAVLRGLTSRAGGMVAAVTTSLPERAEEGRNYDYRYAWIRDQCYAGQAVAANGAHPLLDDAVGFVSARLLDDGPQLRPAYTVAGGQVPAESHVGLPGYPGGADKVGNQVGTQFQIDAFGEALLLLASAARLDRLDNDHWRAAEAAVAAIEQRWRDPGAGIWELGDERWTHSRLICAAGLRAIAQAAPTRQGAAWQGLADTLVADAARDCLHPTGRWQRSPTDGRVDAALLLPVIRGALPAHDPRSRATFEAVRRELAEDYYLYRFRQDERPLHEAEGAFLLCGFEMAMAVHQQGETAEALRWFERNRAACGPPGLFTEEYDVVQRQLRGNLPQAFVHALLLESARRLAGPWTDDHTALG
ncbi:MAG TPA: glycoside hydrolase family 15 protein [Nocardioidaceae bacterium]|nr:glycoside hydrolase family 15 protein [Nocardioidaceae bacterium]